MMTRKEALAAETFWICMRCGFGVWSPVVLPRRCPVCRSFPAEVAA